MASPTIILMLKAPVVGTVKTRLATTVGAEEALRIYRMLVERQLLALPLAWSVSVHYTPNESESLMRSWLTPRRAGLNFTPQASGDLGQRLSAAFATEFQNGATAVLAVGGDCPGLDLAVLSSAHESLLSTDAVIGPAADGGYYLLGLQEPHPALFQGIRWSTPEVLIRTRGKMQAEGLTWTELPLLEDVDDHPDWLRAQANGLMPEGSAQK